MISKHNQEYVTINKTAFATTLAHVYVNCKFQSLLTMYKTDFNGVTSYADEVQEVFDAIYKMYITMLEDTRYDK